MMQRSLSNTLSSDFGAPTQVVKMSPGGRKPYGSYPMAQQPDGSWAPNAQGKARETNDDTAKVSVSEATRAAFNKDQRLYNDWQRSQKAAQQAAHGEQSLADQARGLIDQETAQDRIITGQGADHYVYRQHPDNGVTVIKNTKTGATLDVYYSPDSQAAQNVIAAYGPHPASVAGPSQGQPGQPQQEMSVWDKISKATGIASDVAAATGVSQKPADEEKKDNTLLYVGLGVGGLLALGLIVMAATRGKD
jgi:hypothetical protein